jgi:hypothetical protein
LLLRKFFQQPSGISTTRSTLQKPNTLIAHKQSAWLKTERLSLLQYTSFPLAEVFTGIADYARILYATCLTYLTIMLSIVLYYPSHLHLHGSTLLGIFWILLFEPDNILHKLTVFLVEYFFITLSFIQLLAVQSFTICNQPTVSHDIFYHKKNTHTYPFCLDSHLSFIST